MVVSNTADVQLASSSLLTLFGVAVSASRHLRGTSNATQTVSVMAYCVKDTTPFSYSAMKKTFRVYNLCYCHICCRAPLIIISVPRVG